jgi:hypothetical protein
MKPDPKDEEIKRLKKTIAELVAMLLKMGASHKKHTVKA